ncbi:hypothetical protein JOD57_003314 [Geodermatophilus bullaregiensis]|uniref:hypothetical protein n=1 Tax=Geodermatophilus bullaregiensis TaxID=1564160 RepID=UPI00195C36CC|nr:hypothetical protein [Geodermatophilus bullaregiensis]MBM7807477.1 hypothetical protein [Geodermatophilus bullaregiensis]
MSHPSPADGPTPVPPSWDPPSWAPPAAGAVPAGAVAPGAWTPWGTWDPTAGRTPVTLPAPAPAAPASGGRPVLTALATAAVLALGMVLAATVGALVLTGAADDVGQAIGEGMTSSVTEDLGWYADPYPTGGVLGSVEQFDPVAPGGLGSDPVLDGYAQSCFDGNLQACDDLYLESPPLSAYEEYATTCGGRVKQYEVPYCTDLD